MKKLIDPLVVGGTQVCENGRSFILINLKIKSATKVTYAAPYAGKGSLRYLLEIEGPNGTIHMVLPERDLHSKKLLHLLSNEYEKYDRSFSLYVDEHIGLDRATIKTRKSIQEDANRNQIYEVPYYGGWMEVQYPYPTYGTIRYSYPINSQLRQYALNDVSGFKSFYDQTLTRCHVIVQQHPAEIIKKSLPPFSYILNADIRLFLFLFWHYCYMASLFYMYQPDFILSFDIFDHLLQHAMIHTFWGQMNQTYCEMEFNSTANNKFTKNFLQAKDIPFILKERVTAGRNTFRSKVSKIQDIIEDQRNKSSNSPVPILFPNAEHDYPGLLHLELERQDFSEDVFMQRVPDFYSYFSKMQMYFNKQSWDTLLTQNISRYREKSHASVYYIFSTLLCFLQEYYSRANFSAQQTLGIDLNIDVEEFLDNFLSEHLDPPKADSQEFLKILIGQINAGEIKSYQRLGKISDDCVSHDTLTNTPCVLFHESDWALNNLAFNKVLASLPHTFSPTTMLRTLDHSGILSKARINRNSYQNKLLVHLSDGAPVTHTFIVLHLPQSPIPKAHIDAIPVEGHRFFYLGENPGTGNPVYWDFDRKENMNRHLFITGKSGAGKSFLIQRLVKQAADYHITTIVFHNQGDLPSVPGQQVIDIKRDKPGICISDAGNPLPNDTPVISLQKALHLRISQGKVFRACYKEYLKDNDSPDFFGFMLNFKKIAKKLGYSNYQSIQYHLDEILDDQIFSGKPINWQEAIGKTLILDFRSFCYDPHLLQIQTELLLWDLLHFKEQQPDFPLIAVVDEFHRLNVNDDSALTTIIREGRKFGWSLWMSSQTENGKQLKSLSSQSSLQIYFSQGAKGNRSIANIIGMTAKEKEELFTTLQGLLPGEFLFQQDGCLPVRCDGRQTP